MQPDELTMNSQELFQSAHDLADKMNSSKNKKEVVKRDSLKPVGIVLYRLVLGQKPVKGSPTHSQNSCSL